MPQENLFANKPPSENPEFKPWEQRLGPGMSGRDQVNPP